MVFVDILSSQPLDKNSMTSALNTMAIESRADNREYHVKPDSIVFRGMYSFSRLVHHFVSNY